MKTVILDRVSDLVANFLYWDRRNDHELPRLVIENAVKNGDVTVDEIVNEFRRQLVKILI
jgi:hypothetical protein